MTAAVALDTPSVAGFPVVRGGSVTAWAMGPVEAWLYPGEPALAEDRVDYRFVNGFVDVGDLPCRVALWREIATRTVVLQDVTVEALNLPGFNRRVEFSGFWHRPTRLARWLKTRLVPAEPGPARFRLSTCGGVHVWVDGRLAARFEPFQRNRDSATEITLDLADGGSEIVLLSEELAERDTNWFVELTLLSDAPLTAVLPVDVSAEAIGVLMRLATDVRPDPMHVADGRLVLRVEAPEAVDVTVTARVLPSVHMRHKPPLLAAGGILRAGEVTLALDGADRLADGYHPLDLVFAIGAARVERHIAFATFTEPRRAWGGLTLAKRKARVLDHLADHGEDRIGRVLARLAAGRPFEAIDRAIVADTLAAIDERRDCSDFVLVPLLWVATVHADRLPTDMADDITRSILGYRYWVDEPGNDVMWFWSENHVLCFHVSQYLAGRLHPDELFTASRRRGAEQARLGEARLMRWFDSVEAHGLAEWNSAAYYPIDFIGLLALEHLGDGAVKARARALLDRLFAMIALHTIGGVPGGSMGRAYDKELRAGPLTELAPFATLAFGDGWLNDGVAALPEFAAGTYEPPGDVLAHVAPEPGRPIQAHYVQGHDQAARLALAKTAAVQLSVVECGMPGGAGHQQHVVDVRFAGHPFARAFVNHPGEDDPWGHRRPSYWAGNGSLPRAALHGDTALMLYDLGPDPRIPFTHAYVEARAFDAVIVEQDRILIRLGAGFAALMATRPIVPVTAGPGAGIEFRAEGNRVGWLIRIGEGGDAAFQRFRDSVAATRLSLADGDATLTAALPDRSVLALSWQDGLRVDGAPRPFPHLALDPLVRPADGFLS